ncbi:MAG: tRNA pseudouridine(38-40) synthase TruA [Lentimicrobiaceae bacterium]|nr:tRNA pseudouridine(38-40) synthase TruA [Lentimicrobiaceae bacterium]
MYRYFAKLAYMGTPFHGWQTQPNAVTVQEIIEKCFSLIFGEPVAVTGCGRTDTGVHASEYYLHFDVLTLLDRKKKEDWLFRLNNFLPNEITVNNLFQVKENAHARFDAISRTYSYYISRKKNPFQQAFTMYYYGYLNIENMNKAAKILMEFTDFSCFSKSKTDVITNNCAVTETFWTEKDGQLVFTISANRFLRNMVRAIVGTLLEIGRERMLVDDIKKIIEGKNRSDAGASVPAKGLFLTKVVYPEHIFV